MIEPDAARRFRTVFLWSMPEARCYMLTARHQLDPAGFKTCAEQFRQNPPDRVKTMSGCLGRVVDGLVVLQQIEAGHYVPFLPKGR